MWPPFSCKVNGVSLSHLPSEIISKSLNKKVLMNGEAKGIVT